MATLQALLAATRLDLIGRFGSHELILLTPPARLSDMAESPSTGIIGSKRTRPQKHKRQVPIGEPTGIIGAPRWRASGSPPSLH